MAPEVFSRDDNYGAGGDMYAHPLFNQPAPVESENFHFRYPDPLRGLVRLVIREAKPVDASIGWGCEARGECL